MTTLEADVSELRQRVARLEARVAQLTASHDTVPSIAAGSFTDAIELREWLQTMGLIREPTEAEQQLATEWETLPDREKQLTRVELDHLAPGPLASDLIHEHRR